ncbi:hypothetical protein ES288_D12G184800v1, partial [Gossypium darwinii]
KKIPHLTTSNENVNIISGNAKLIEGSGTATILLPQWTIFIINDALFSSKSWRNLLSFKYIYRNGYHIETINEKSIKYLQFITIIFEKKCVLEKLHALFSSLYYTTISTIETHAIV